MVTVARVRPGTIADELGIEPGTELAGGERTRARRLSRLGVPDRGRRRCSSTRGSPTARKSSTTSSAPKANRWASSSSRPRSAAAPIAASSASSRACRRDFAKPLYIRDDDYRLSFAYGNFATLSNLKERDIARILEYRLSPLYVSVHATPWEARKVLLNNPRVPNIVEQLTRLADGRHPVPRPDGDRARA